MVVPLTPEMFYNGARDFAQTALEAHHAGKYRRVALDAGTALEHLAKACLATRSPALLTELKNEASFPSLLRLIGITEGRTPRRLRTVGLRDALERVKAFVLSKASDDDLRTLVDMRDGTVHAAQGDEVEERLVVAFVQHADALLDDLGHDRAAFWGGQLAVVDALLADASDKVAHHVEVKLAAATANFESRYGDVRPEMLRLVRQLSISRDLDATEAKARCAACESMGIADGDFEVEWNYEPDGNPVGTVWFTADRFECRVCGLRLDSPAEFAAARLQSRWEVEEADPHEIEEPYDRDAYDAWREERRIWEG